MDRRAQIVLGDGGLFSQAQGGREQHAVLAMGEPLHGNQTPTAAALVVPSEVAQVRLSRGRVGIEVIDEEVTSESR